MIAASRGIPRATDGGREEEMVDHELNELRREFLDEARVKVDEMAATLGELSEPSALQRLAYLAHQLKGSGGSYGYQQLSEDAAEIEKAAETLPSQNGTRSTIEEKVRDHVRNMQNEIESAVRALSV